jgi:hypothetical protein
MTEGFMTTIKRLLREDAGLSAGGVPANSAGAGKLDCIGIGPKGEPGGRKKRRETRRRDLKFLATLARGGTVELSHFHEDEIDEGEPVVDTSPTLDNDRPDVKDPKNKTTKKSLKRGDAEIVIAPFAGPI